MMKAAVPLEVEPKYNGGFVKQDLLGVQAHCDDPELRLEKSPRLAQFVGQRHHQQHWRVAQESCDHPREPKLFAAKPLWVMKTPNSKKNLLPVKGRPLMVWYLPLVAQDVGP